MNEELVLRQLWVVPTDAVSYEIAHGAADALPEGLEEIIDIPCRFLTGPAQRLVFAVTKSNANRLMRNENNMQ